MAAFQKAGFFNGNSYSASDFAQVMFSLNGDGVDVRYGNQLECSVSGTTITVQSGAAWLLGYFGWNETSTTLTETTGTHKDYICVHVDESTGTFELVILAGEAGGELPDLPGTNYMPIYKAIVSSGTVTLTDMRSYCYGNTGVDKQRIQITSAILTASSYSDGTLIFKPTLS